MAINKQAILRLDLLSSLKRGQNSPFLIKFASNVFYLENVSPKKSPLFQLERWAWLANVKPM
jgi:hypothetical protein